MEKFFSTTSRQPFRTNGTTGGCARVESKMPDSFKPRTTSSAPAPSMVSPRTPPSTNGERTTSGQPFDGPQKPQTPRPDTHSNDDRPAITFAHRNGIASARSESPHKDRSVASSNADLIRASSSHIPLVASIRLLDRVHRIEIRIRQIFDRDSRIGLILRQRLDKPVQHLHSAGPWRLHLPDSTAANDNESPPAAGPSWSLGRCHAPRSAPLIRVRNP